MFGDQTAAGARVDAGREQIFVPPLSSGRRHACERCDDLAAVCGDVWQGRRDGTQFVTDRVVVAAVISLNLTLAGRDRGRAGESGWAGRRAEQRTLICRAGADA